jgi:hypothetical protein
LEERIFQTFPFSNDVFIFILLVSLAVGGYSTEGLAKSSPCQKEYARVIKVNVRHRAVATSLGLPLSAKNIACGFSGQDTKQQAVSDALHNCNKSAKKNRNPKKCLIIEAK